MPRGRPRKARQDVLARSAEFIGWALGGLEREIVQTRERLSALTEQAARLRSRLGRGGVRGAAADAAAAGGGKAGRRGRRRRRGQMSAEARKRISELMRKRWAARKKAGKNRL
jgi:hypothetical protein